MILSVFCNFNILQLFTFCIACGSIKIAHSKITNKKTRKDKIMKERFVERFEGTMTKFAEDELNEFLEANPDYRIVCMTYVNKNSFYYGIIAYFEKIE